MIKTHRINNPKKAHNTVSDKRGFTLVELTVVMALVAILMVMIVSFSTMMGDFAGAEESEYAFLEDVSALKETLSDWVAENDVEGSNFTFGNENTKLICMPKGGNPFSISFDRGVLSRETEEKTGLDEINSVSFELSDTHNLIKCTVIDKSEKRMVSFVISLRSAGIFRG